MKTQLLSLVMGSTSMISALANAVPLGTIIPERITYSEGISNASRSEVVNLTEADFGDFDGQVLVVVYHASW